MRFLVSLSDGLADYPDQVGGKSVGLHRLMAMNDIEVPKGFVITTDAYRVICSGCIQENTEKMEAAAFDAEMLEASAKMRQAIECAPLPAAFLRELDAALEQYAPDALFAVRSSATAEDLPDASFAGQQDSYLNIQAVDVPAAILRCFASLYNDRAVAYRIKHGYQNRDLAMAVIVQEMAPAQVSGVLFTADPMTSDRCTSVIEAVEGLGEDLVSGRKTPYTWRLREGCIRADSAGSAPLTEAQVHLLADLGKEIASQMGAPQDIEWCFTDGQFYFVQTRAITTLFPAPVSPDGLKRLFVSAGHMQMMTDAMLPLGISFMKLIALFQMVEAGGRLFIDITHDMKTAYGRKMIRTKLSAMDPLIYQATEEVMQRREYIAGIPKGKGSFSNFSGWMPMIREGIRLYRNNNPADIDRYVKRMERSVEDLEQTLAPLQGEALLEGIMGDQEQLFHILYDATGFGMVLATQFILQKIDQIGKKLTGEEGLSNRLSKSVRHNISSEMGLALSEVADLAREDPAVTALLEQAGEDFQIDKLREINRAVADAFADFLRRFGMRATGEIDISKTRFRENPAELINILLTNIRTLPAGYGADSFEKGRIEMEALAEEMIQLAGRQLGRRKAGKLRRYISFFRNYVGTREYPKYFWICRYDIYKKAVQREAERLVQAGILEEANDIYYLYLEELQESIRSGVADYDTICQRKADYRRYDALTPPRLIFSDGEVPEMEYRNDIPEGALGGLGVSGGVVEGRARVIRSIEQANMERGDILVTSFTDPSWTPVFVSVAGLVTEIGGMMTHGAVITREYGLPAVVGVLGATKKIRDGDRIRINGDRGYVEILNKV